MNPENRKLIMDILPILLPVLGTLLGAAPGFAGSIIITWLNELPRRKQRGIKNFKFCHSALDAESRVPGENRDPVFGMVPDFRRDDVWIPASAGMTNSPQAAGNTTRRD